MPDPISQSPKKLDPFNIHFNDKRYKQVEYTFLTTFWHFNTFNFLNWWNIKIRCFCKNPETTTSPNKPIGSNYSNLSLVTNKTSVYHTEVVERNLQYRNFTELEAADKSMRCTLASHYSNTIPRKILGMNYKLNVANRTSLYGSRKEKNETSDRDHQHTYRCVRYI